MTVYIDLCGFHILLGRILDIISKISIIGDDNKRYYIHTYLENA